MTLKSKFQDVSGNVLGSDYMESYRGADRVEGDVTSYYSAGSRHQYSTHGVQGGNTYGAGAVYTYTSLNY